MTCNTISLVSRLIWERFRWKFMDIFEDVCSLHICFSAESFHLLCCITPCESSGRFWGPLGTSDYLCSFRKQTVIHLPTPPENVTTLACELQNFFIWLKVCCIHSNIRSSEKRQLWVVVGGSERTGCDVWQLEFQASNVTASVQSDHLLL